MWDLRIPIGYFFLLLGAILVAISFTHPTAPLETGNVDLVVGLIMLVFGGGMRWLARRA